jgi:hypothetical protein
MYTVLRTSFNLTTVRIPSIQDHFTALKLSQSYLYRRIVSPSSRLPWRGQDERKRKQLPTSNLTSRDRLQILILWKFGPEDKTTVTVGYSQNGLSVQPRCRAIEPQHRKCPGPSRRYGYGSRRRRRRRRLCPVNRDIICHQHRIQHSKRDRGEWPHLSCLRETYAFYSDGP